MAVSELHNPRILAKKIVKPTTLTKISFTILQNLKFENYFKF